MVRFLYVVTLLATAVGGFVLVIGLSHATSAPQEAAAAATALALAVIPYVFARCVQLSNDYNERRADSKRVISLLEDIRARNSPG